MQFNFEAGGGSLEVCCVAAPLACAFRLVVKLSLALLAKSGWF